MATRVTFVRVSFTREKQPAQYEKSAPAIEFAANIDEGDDHVEAGLRLMADACRVVYAGLGFDIPERVAAKLGASVVPGRGRVEVEPESQPEPAAGAEAFAKDSMKKTRAKKGQQAEPASSTKPAAPAAEMAAPAKVAPSDIPDGSTPVAAEKPSEIQQEEPAGVSKEALNELVSNLVSSRKIAVADVKAILASRKVVRLIDLDQEGRDFVAEKIKERVAGLAK